MSQKCSFISPTPRNSRSQNHWTTEYLKLEGIPKDPDQGVCVQYMGQEWVEAAVQDFALAQAVVESPIKGFEKCHHGGPRLPRTGKALSGSGRKEKHRRKIKMRWWRPKEAAVSFLNRRELQDKGQAGEELTVNWPGSPPVGTERDPGGCVEENHECKVLKGLVSIGKPRETGTERWERCARSCRGASGGQGMEQPPLVALWFPELITGRPCFLTNSLSVASWGREGKVSKDRVLPRNMNCG